MSGLTPASSVDVKPSKLANGKHRIPSQPTSPQSPTRKDSASHLNPRSCVTCRRRKVRCDKRNPCSNCVKQGIECIFPGPGRAPRKARKPPDAELLLRLRKLEGVVKSLGAQVDEDGGITHTGRAMASIQDQLSQNSSGESPEPEEGTSKRSAIDIGLGRLVNIERCSRYV